MQGSAKNVSLAGNGFRTFQSCPQRQTDIFLKFGPNTHHGDKLWSDRNK